MALLNAVQTDSLEKIKEIVESKGISFNTKWVDYAVLNTAIGCGRKDVAMYLLEKKCRVNKTSKTGELSKINTPLHNAVKLKDLELVSCLLDKEAWVDAVNPEGDTPLHMAFLTRQEKIVDAILNHLQNHINYSNVANTQGLTHMHIACARNNAELVQKFLDAGANLNDTVKADSTIWPGYTALHFAVQFRSLRVATVLKKANNFINLEDNNGQNPLQMAYEKLKDLSAMIHILTTDNANNKGDQPKQLSYFHLACLRDDPTAVETFINNGVDVNLTVSRAATFCPLYTPLHCAVESNCKRNVELLLEHGAEVDSLNNDDMTPLHLALYNEDCRQKDTIVDLLYNAMPNKDSLGADMNGLTYFHIAVTRNDIRQVKKFLAKDEVNVNDPILYNTRKFAHFTPLHFSVLYGHQEMTELLVKQTCNFNRSDCGWHGTPLHLAFEIGHKGIIDFLLKKGARLDNIRLYDNKTMLHILVEYCVIHDETDWCLDYIELLVKHCNVNAKDAFGNTALHIACAKFDNGVECARLLLEFGADIDVENEKGKTPFELSFYSSFEVDVEDYMMLYEHVQKLKAIGWKINPKNEICCETLFEAHQQLIEKEELPRMQQEIRDEIAKLRSIKLSQRVTIFDFLIFDQKQRLAYYVNHDVLKNTIESKDLDEQLPLYGYLLKLQYQKGIEYLEARSREAEKRAAKGDGYSNDRSKKRRY